MKQSLFSCILLLSSVLPAACSKLDDPSLNPLGNVDGRPVPALAERVYQSNKQVFFGDLHIHTGLSTDAYVLGVRTEPEDVYKYARGEAIPHAAGFPIQIDRPLDFAAVTDHAEYMGQARLANLDIPTNRQTVAEILRGESPLKVTQLWVESSNHIRENGFSPGGEAVNNVVNLSAWQQTIDAAEKNYEPGVFTSFIGYEWSASAGSILAHMHRNVIYRSNQVSEIPFSSLNSQRPEDLWRFLDQETGEGRVAMAIPHNANFSQGNMYASVDSQGRAFTAEYAALRSRYEPISEILQIKGSSETHPLLSTEDEFADFELLGESLFTVGDQPSSIKGSYLRDALRTGMEFAHSEGFNPFKYGVIGSSDSHNASSPTQESNYTGKLPMLDGSAGLRTGEILLLPEGVNPVTRWSSGGLAGVWAEENTRESLFDALQRKETYATSGPRITLRFFGGWGLSEGMLSRTNMIETAYAQGVPMGGELGSQGGEQSPRFLIMAAKDPEGANLDRAQIIKAWVDGQGNSHEKVFDIAAADERQLDPESGKLPARKGVPGACHLGGMDDFLSD
ncbi:MAG: DUF3604 domain-containing protein, partial [Halieaceae bacterium]|nr:DUF3604 domain-containing protein [Halieaceae bacterium]